MLQFVRLVGPQQPRLRFPLLLQCGLCILPALPCLHALVEGSLWGRAVGRSTVSSLVALADSALEESSPSSCVGEALARVGSAATVSAQLGHLMSKSTSLDQALFKLFKLPVGQCHATQGWMAGGTVGSLMSIPDTNEVSRPPISTKSDHESIHFPQVCHMRGAKNTAGAETHSPTPKEHFFWKIHHCISNYIDIYTNAEYWGNKQVLKSEARDLAQLWSCESRSRLSTDTDGTLGNRRTFFLLRQGLR